MTELSPLSPAAQTVFYAFNSKFDWIEDGVPGPQFNAIAAALRAAADQVVPEEPRPPRRGVRPGGTDALTPEEGAEDQRAATRRQFLAIAAELENAR